MLEGDEAEEAVEEATAAKTARDPQAPSKAEWLAHQATHLPYRSWCQECVAGRRDNPGHRRVPAEERLVPEVMLDYAFVRTDDERETLTILVVKDRESRAIRASVMTMKGACNEEAGEKAAEAIQGFGHRGKLLIKVDNEPALKSLRDEVILKLDQGVICVAPPAGESQSNGAVENGVKLFKGVLSVHLMALEKKLGGVTIPSAHPIMTWLVEYVSDILTKYMIGADGKTAYQRLFGKKTHEEELELGNL